MRHSFKKNASLSKLQHQETPVLFLPGWGFDGRICELVQPPVAWIYPTTMLDPDTLTADILAHLHRTAINKIELVGWSMGAMLALDFARQHPERVSRLTLVAMGARWSAQELKRLQEELAADPAGFLKGFYRKCFIGQREKAMDFAATLQPEYLAGSPEALGLLQKGLSYLGRTEIRSVDAIETRLIHGRQDIVAPLAEMAHLPAATVEIIEHCGHLPFLSPACSLHPGSRQATIRRHFSRAAATYDEHAAIQQDLAARLSARLTHDPTNRKPASILEIGCGTGNYTRMLANNFPDSSLLALDFSPVMISTARRKLAPHKHIDFICADGEEFLARRRPQGRHFDLITSNSTLQWFTDLQHAFGHIGDHLLAPDGLLLCSLFGPRTLAELGKGLTTVFGRRVQLAAANFPDLRKVREMLGNHFSSTGIEEVQVIKEYPTVIDLLTHIRKTGTSGWHAQEPLRFSRPRLNELNDWFIDTYGSCRVSYQAFLVRAENRSAQSQTINSLK